MQRLIQEIKKRPKLINIIFSGMGIIYKFYMYLVNKIIGVNDNKVVFSSFKGKSYSDNPRAISEKLHEMCPEFEIVWIFKNPKEKEKIVPNYIRCVRANSYRSLMEMATAKFWVDNFSKPIYLYKSKKQVYIQTWHGDRGFKKILYDVRTLMPNGHYREGDLIESKYCDLAVSGSDYGDRKFETAFQYSGQIMKYGCPRNDILVGNNSNKRNFIKKQIEIEENTCILLFAPTFRAEAIREHKLQTKNDIDLLAVIKTLEERTNKKWLCLIRAHSAVKGLEGIPRNENKIIDVTSYEDMSDLLLITDFLITDYSSCAGDFALLSRPLVLYQPDRQNYQKQDRTFYFNLDASPYMIAKNQRDLTILINNMEWETIPKYCRKILDFYGAVETGEASKKVVEYILNK